MICKELLSEVLDIQGLKIETITVYDYSIEWNLSLEDLSSTCVFHAMGGYSINIYELAHKCKEWAESLGYTIWSNCKLTQIQNKYGSYILEVKGEETNSIIESCQWILDNKDNQ